MASKIQLFPSGIPLVDLEWGGLYRSGTYFVIGPQKSGRTLLSLQYAFECALRKEVCVFFTTLRPKDLLIHAASIGFDLQHYMNQNLVIVVKVTPPEDLENAEDPDAYLAEYIKDIIPVIEHYKPAKIVFDELTNFVGFRSAEYLNEIFSKTIEHIEDRGITSLFVLAQPANSAAHQIVDTLSDMSTGIITLEKQTDKENKYFAGIMSIVAHIGHTEGNFSSEYFIEPRKGVTADYSLSSSREPEHDITPGKSKDMVDSFSDISLKHETVSYPNVYSLSDFQLLINNQIAMYQITGKIFKLAAIWLDEVAEKQSLLNIHQLQNAIRISTDKKHKICTIGNKVFVLIPNPVKSTIVNLVSEIKSNLPEDNPEYLHIISRLISIYSVDVDKEVKNAEGMIAQILKETSISPN